MAEGLVSATVDTRPLDRAFEELKAGTGTRIFLRSKRKGERAMRTVAINAAFKKLNLKKDEIRKALVIRQGKAASVQVTIKARPVNLALFGARRRKTGQRVFGVRQQKAGVKVKKFRSGPKRLIRGAFIATMASGHTGVFMRNRERIKTRRKESKYAQLGIRELHGPWVIDTIRNKRLVKLIQKTGRDVYLAEQRRLLKRAFG